MKPNRSRLRDLAVLTRLLLRRSGWWLVFVHQGHITKVAEVGRPAEVKDLDMLLTQHDSMVELGATE